MNTRLRNHTRKALAAITVTVASFGVAVTTATPAVADGPYSGRAKAPGCAVSAVQLIGLWVHFDVDVVIELAVPDGR